MQKYILNIGKQYIFIATALHPLTYNMLTLFGRSVIFLTSTLFQRSAPQLFFIDCWNICTSVEFSLTAFKRKTEQFYLKWQILQFQVCKYMYLITNGGGLPQKDLHFWCTVKKCKIFSYFSKTVTNTTNFNEPEFQGKLVIYNFFWLNCSSNKFTHLKVGKLQTFLLFTN